MVNSISSFLPTELGLNKTDNYLNALLGFLFRFGQSNDTRMNELALLPHLASINILMI